MVLADARLYYYKARVYDPVFGRFLQTDPIGSKDDLDLYAYVGGDPVNKSDTTGNGPEIAACALTGPGAPFCAGGDLIISGAVIACAATNCVKKFGDWLHHNDSSPGTEVSPGNQSDEDAPQEVTPEDLTDKTPEEVHDLAKGKGFVPDAKNPNKYRDPVTGNERIRIDNGHVDPKTGKPYDNPNAAGDHAHGYGPDGKTPVRDPVTGDKHFPLKKPGS